MRNKKIAARIQAALERSQTPQHSATIPNDRPTQKLAKIQSIVDGRVAGERNWKVDEIAKQENIGYMTVYRSLKGKPGWFAYGRTIRITEALYRNWLTAMGLHMSLDEYLSLPQAS